MGSPALFHQNAACNAKVPNSVDRWLGEPGSLGKNFGTLLAQWPGASIPGHQGSKVQTFVVPHYLTQMEPASGLP